MCRGISGLSFCQTVIIKRDSNSQSKPSDNNHSRRYLVRMFISITYAPRSHPFTLVIVLGFLPWSLLVTKKCAIWNTHQKSELSCSFHRAFLHSTHHCSKERWLSANTFVGTSYTLLQGSKNRIRGSKKIKQLVQISFSHFFAFRHKNIFLWCGGRKKGNRISNIQFICEFRLILFKFCLLPRLYVYIV